jgi:thiol-disulfide isomerase/thioredoxin
LAEVEQRIALKKNQEMLTAGAVFPDFAVKDLAGQPLSVTQFKGQVVLLDFWATWCPVCVMEMPSVAALYQKYHAQGLEIIGLNMDSDRKKLDDFLKQNSTVVWPQYCDGEDGKHQLAIKYGVELLPLTLLIGPDGKIIGKNLRGPALAEAVAASINRK